MPNRKMRGPLAATLIFGGMLVPALGFVNVYPFIYSFVADHFQYLASTAMISLDGAGLTLLATRWRVPEWNRDADQGGNVSMAAENSAPERELVPAVALVPVSRRE